MITSSNFVFVPADRLIHAVDELCRKLVVTGDTEILSSNSLVFAVRKVDGSNFPATAVDILSTDDVQVSTCLVKYTRSESRRSFINRLCGCVVQQVRVQKLEVGSGVGLLALLPHRGPQS